METQRTDSDLTSVNHPTSTALFETVSCSFTFLVCIPFTWSPELIYICKLETLNSSCEPL